MSFTLRGATKVALQLHQILRLPCKINLMSDPCHIWNVISNARSNKSHPPTSPNTAPATQKLISWVILVTYETSCPMRDTSTVTRQPHQILRLPRNSESKMSSDSPWIASAKRKTIRRYPTILDDNPSIKSSSRTRRFGDLTRPVLETHFVWNSTTFRARAIYQNCTKYCTCHPKWILSVICSTHLFYTHLFSTHLCIYSLRISSLLIYSLLIYSLPILFSTIVYSSMLYSSMLFSFYSLLILILFSTMVYSSILYSSMLFSFYSHSSILYSSILYSSILHPFYSLLIHSHFQNFVTRKFLN